MKSISISFWAFLLLLSPVMMQAQCSCNELKNAFYSETKFANSGDYIKDVRSFFGTRAFSDFIKTKESTKGVYKVAIPVEGVAAESRPNENSNFTDYDVVKENIINGSTNYYNIGWANYMVSAIVNDAAVDAYFKCANKCSKTGLSITLVSDNGNKLGLLLRYEANGANKDSRIKKVIVYGAEVVNPINLKENTLIDAAGKVVVLNRKLGEDLVISVNMQDNQGTTYINYPSRNAMAKKTTEQCKGEWLNVNNNYDSLMINPWNICLDASKKEITAAGKDATLNPKYNNLKNMIYALTAIKDLKNLFATLLTDPNKNTPELFLQQAKLESLETQYNTDRTAFLGNSNLINPCNICYDKY